MEAKTAQQDHAPQPGLLSREQAANYLGISPETLAVWACVKRYNLPFVKVGRLARYRKSDLDAFIASRTVGGVAA